MCFELLSVLDARRFRLTLDCVLRGKTNDLALYIDHPTADRNNAGAHTDDSSEDDCLR